MTIEKESKESSDPIAHEESSDLTPAPEVTSPQQVSRLEGEPHEETTVDFEPDAAVVNSEPTLEEAVPSEAELKRDEYYDLLQRERAEFKNYKKRTAGDRIELATSAAKELITELLPLIDDLKLAIKGASLDPAHSAHGEGVELIYRQLMKILEKRGLTAIDAEGNDFDPNLHEAMTHEISDRHRNSEVIEDLRTGYMLSNQLLRATWVKVAKSE